MSLKSIEYVEFENEPQYWKLEHCDFIQVNLIVGRNAAGKSRLISVINGLSRLLSGRHAEPYMSGSYKVEIVLLGKTYLLCLEFSSGRVMRESLEIDGVTRLTRNPDGTGNIYYEKQDAYIEFQVPPNAIVLQQRRDELQHSFIVELWKWALGSQAYFFGSSLGKDRLVGLSSLEAAISQPDQAIETVDLVSIYTKSFSQYGEPFDAAIIRDMKSLGYELVDVGTTDIRPMSPGLNLPEAVIGIFVIEADRQVHLTQLNMSQGMFRALAMVIHISVALFGGQRTLILVDDIGEGLDYERSISLIELLIRHAKDSNLQIIMTSNDRFVMNSVPLEHWALLRRTGAVVHVHNERNSAKEFGEFKYMGLSNFDFFNSISFK